MNLILRHQAIIIVMAGVFYFVNLGTASLFNDDESKNAVGALEMSRLGHWVVPTFDGKLRTDRPILFDWLTIISFRLFEPSEFAARFASSAMAVGTALLTYHLGRKLYSKEIGFLASIILCTFFLFSVVQRSATPDSAEVFFITLSLTGYVWIVAQQREGHFSRREEASTDDTDSSDEDSDSEEEHSTDVPKASSTDADKLTLVTLRSCPLAIVTFVSMGLAVLTSGLSGAILPCATIMLFHLIIRRNQDIDRERLKPPEGPWWRRSAITITQTLRPLPMIEVFLSTKLWLGLCLVLVVALPWYLVVGPMTDGAWPRGFFLNQEINYATVVDSIRSGFPFFQLYHVVTLHVGCFPWSVFFLVALFQLWERLSEDVPWKDSDRFLVCWCGIWFVFFSLASPRHFGDLLPMYPAVALILARYFEDWRHADGPHDVYSVMLCLRALGLAGCVMTIGLYIAAYLFLSNEQSNETWIGAIGLLPLIGAIVGTKLLDYDQRRRVIQTLIVTAVIATILIVNAMPASIAPYQDSKLFVAEARKWARTPVIKLATYKYEDPSLAFYAGERVPQLETLRQVADFIAGHPHAFVITEARNHNELREELRDDTSELARHRSFQGRDELILLGRQGQPL